MPGYVSLIRTVLEYGAIVWSRWNQADTEKFEKVQRRCLNLCGQSIILDSLIVK